MIIAKSSCSDSVGDLLLGILMSTSRANITLCEVRLPTAPPLTSWLYFRRCILQVLCINDFTEAEEQLLSTERTVVWV